jgi:DNA-binding transcriptional LysR family regulator
MDLRQLECFVAVARHRHFTRAAEDLYLTQSAVSQQVRRLEAQVGLDLLRRTPRGVELTAAGAELLPRAEAILADVARARAAMDELASGTVRGSVRVAATTGDAPGLAAALAGFHGERPGVRVALRHGSADEVVDLVRRGSADLGVAALRDGAATDGVEAAPLAAQPLVVLLPAADGVAGAAEVGLWDLRERPFILGEPATALRELVTAACEAAGFGPVPLFEVGDPETVRVLVAAGLGVAVVPASWARGEGVATAALAPPAPELEPRLLARPGGLTPPAALLHAHLRAALGGELEDPGRLSQ